MVIQKLRYFVPDAPDGVLRLEAYCTIDEYQGRYSGRWVVEREFSTPEEMAEWKPPGWLVEAGCREVTADPRYSNSSLSQNGWPEEDQ